MIAGVHAAGFFLDNAGIQEGNILGKIKEVDPLRNVVLALFPETVEGGAEHVAAEILAVTQQLLEGGKASLPFHGVEVPRHDGGVRLPLRANTVGKYAKLIDPGFLHSVIGMNVINEKDLAVAVTKGDVSGDTVMDAPPTLAHYVGRFGEPKGSSLQEHESFRVKKDGTTFAVYRIVTIGHHAGITFEMVAEKGVLRRLHLLQTQEVGTDLAHVSQAITGAVVPMARAEVTVVVEETDVVTHDRDLFLAVGRRHFLAKEQIFDAIK